MRSLRYFDMEISGPPTRKRFLRRSVPTGSGLPLPCTQAPPTYHECMDNPTFEALKRIMELIEPRSGAPAELREDWHRVASWMQKAVEDIDDLETLGSNDPRRELQVR